VPRPPADAGATAQVAWNSAAATERKRCDLSMRSRNGCCAASQKTVKHLKQTNPDRVDAFKSAAQKSVKSILTKFDELQFYIGEGEDAFDGQIVLSFWKDGADAPSFWFFKDALDEEKC
jgi:DNA-directed RNA polymerase alpha subunit